MITDTFLRNRRGGALNADERAALDAAVSEVKKIPARTTIARAGEALHQSTLLLEGIMSRHIDDQKGMRQLVAIQFAGDFADLHAFPLKTLDHDVATATDVTVAVVPHSAIEDLVESRPQLARKLWFATLIDAAIHRAWLFRLGRLDAAGRVAHFLWETNARLACAGLSDGNRFTLQLTQSDLAEICGLTSVHVNRVMRQLREERLCVFRSSIVEILDPIGLAARGQFDGDYLYIDDGSAQPHR